MTKRERPQRLTDAYVWVLVFDGGKRVDQKTENAKPKGTRIDPNRPDAKLGRPVSIILEPQQDHLPWVRRHIPAGARPVFAARTTCSGLTVSSFEFLCGYALNGKRQYTVVDYGTGNKVEGQDNSG